MSRPKIINFPPGAEQGDPYSIWTFDGSVWILDPDQAGTSVRWEDLVDKPQQIDELGINNAVTGGPYTPRQGKSEPEKFWSDEK